MKCPKSHWEESSNREHRRCSSQWRPNSRLCRPVPVSVHGLSSPLRHCPLSATSYSQLITLTPADYKHQLSQYDLLAHRNGPKSIHMRTEDHLFRILLIPVLAPDFYPTRPRPPRILFSCARTCVERQLFSQPCNANDKRLIYCAAYDYYHYLHHGQSCTLFIIPHQDTCHCKPTDWTHCGMHQRHTKPGVLCWWQWQLLALSHQWRGGRRRNCSNPRYIQSELQW